MGAACDRRDASRTHPAPVVAPKTRWGRAKEAAAAPKAGLPEDEGYRFSLTQVMLPFTVDTSSSRSSNFRISRSQWRNSTLTGLP